MCRSRLPPGLAATSQRAITTAVGVNAAAFHHHADSLWLVPASLLTAGHFAASFEIGGAKKEVTSRVAAKAAANSNARIPDFSAAIAMSGRLLDGHSFCHDSCQAATILFRQWLPASTR